MSVKSGVIMPDHHHMLAQRPTQPGSGLTGCHNTHGTPCDQNLSPGTAAAHHSKSADPLEVALAAMSRASPRYLPEASPPRRSRTVEARPVVVGVSRRAWAVTEETSPMISLRSDVGSDCSVTGVSKLPRPLITPHSFWEPVVGAPISVKSEAGGDSCGTSGSQLPRPLVTPQGLKEPVVGATISLKSEAGGDGCGTSGSKLPRPLITQQGFWEPVVERTVFKSPKLSASSTRYAIH